MPTDVSCESRAFTQASMAFGSSIERSERIKVEIFFLTLALIVLGRVVVEIWPKMRGRK
jgi:hypothetical protein